MVRMRYTLITPTIRRPSLVKCCESVNTQTCSDWEHLVIVDGGRGEHSGLSIINRPPQDTPVDTVEAWKDILRLIEHPQRKILYCDRAHRNSGNTCRHDAWAFATGEYVYYLDDDNYLASPLSLEYLKAVTGEWALVPMSSSSDISHRYFADPPGRGRTDTGMYVIRREPARWPDIPNYEADGLFAEELVRKGIPYQTLFHLPPIMVR